MAKITRPKVFLGLLIIFLLAIAVFLAVGQ